MMEIQPKFQILYTEEAVEFLESLEEKARAKVVYNIGFLLSGIPKLRLLSLLHTG